MCLIFLLNFISCDSSKKEHESQSQVKDTIPGQPAVIFDKSKAVEILNFRRTNDYPSSEKDTTICRSWALLGEDIEKILKTSEAITGPDWHHLFEHLPCSITGQLRQTNKTFDFQINGGAWMTISDRDTTLYFGYFKKDGDMIFISTPMDPENEE
jgi:hypothetical protein